MIFSDIFGCKNTMRATNNQKKVRKSKNKNVKASKCQVRTLKTLKTLKTFSKNKIPTSRRDFCF